MRTQICSLFLVVGLLAGCGPSIQIDPKASIDEDIEIDLAEWKQVPALKAIQSGATHYDESPRVDTSVDHAVLVPLCQRLETEFKVQPIALVDDEEPNDAYIEMIAVKLPTDPVAVKGIEAAIREADAQFPGKIETEVGNKWLGLWLEAPETLE